jgi:hypothetical protein
MYRCEKCNREYTNYKYRLLLYVSNVLFLNVRLSVVYPSIHSVCSPSMPFSLSSITVSSEHTFSSMFILISQSLYLDPYEHSIIHKYCDMLYSFLNLMYTGLTEL